VSNFDPESVISINFAVKQFIDFLQKLLCSYLMLAGTLFLPSKGSLWVFLVLILITSFEKMTPKQNKSNWFMCGSKSSKSSMILKVLNIKGQSFCNLSLSQRNYPRNKTSLHYQAFPVEMGSAWDCLFAVVLKVSGSSISYNIYSLK